MKNFLSAEGIDNLRGESFLDLCSEDPGAKP
jgi:hypothetical protein